jgi:hypothetical protein
MANGVCVCVCVCVSVQSSNTLCALAPGLSAGVKLLGKSWSLLLSSLKTCGETKPAATTAHVVTEHRKVTLRHPRKKEKGT